MTPSAWIALAGLAILMSVHAVVVAFMLGRLVQRVAGLEGSSPERAVQSLAIARLEVQMTHVVQKVDGLDSKIDERLGFLQEPPPYAPRAPRRRSGGDIK